MAHLALEARVTTELAAHVLVGHLPGGCVIVGGGTLVEGLDGAAGCARAGGRHGGGRPARRDWRLRSGGRPRSRGPGSGCAPERRPRQRASCRLWAWARTPTRTTRGDRRNGAARAKVRPQTWHLPRPRIGG